MAAAEDSTSRPSSVSPAPEGPLPPKSQGEQKESCWVFFYFFNEKLLFINRYRYPSRCSFRSRPHFGETSRTNDQNFVSVEAYSVGFGFPAAFTLFRTGGQHSQITGQFQRPVAVEQSRQRRHHHRRNGQISVVGVFNVIVAVNGRVQHAQPSSG